MKKCLPFLLTLILLTVANSLLAQGTAFTYAGHLNTGGSAVNGNYDFTFALFNNSAGGSGQVGGTLTNLNVGVTNGLFTTTLDFGANFPGASRWLAIGVRTNGNGSFVALNPLQELTPTPYAIYAPSAGSAASAGSVAATNISGAIALAQLPAAVLTNAAAGVSLTGTFAGNGVGLTNLFAWQLAGNAGTTTGNFLGTTDTQPLELRVGGMRAGLISPSNGSPNIVFGPAQNIISNTTAGASILGGINNTIGPNSSYSVVGGGNQNGIQSGAGYSFLGSGLNNTIQTNANYSVLGGGFQNSIQTGALQSFLGGGQQNTIQNGGGLSFLGGGSLNSVLAGNSFLGAGFFNSIAGSAGNSVLGGGQANSIGFNAGGSVVGGGQANSIAANADHSFIGGGAQNAIAYGETVIVGGFGNSISDFYGFLGGGQDNRVVNGQFSTLVGGFENVIQNAFNGFLGGGLNNTNSASYAFLGGGQLNNVGGNASWGALGGGYSNSVTASYATVPGGSNNVAGGQNSFAAGANAQALHSGAFVWADGQGVPFASTNANSFNVRANGGVHLATGGAGLSVDGSPVLSGNDGGGLLNLNASQLTSGTVPPARLPSSVVTNNQPNVSLGNLSMGSLTLGGALDLPFPIAINFSSGLSSYSPFLASANANLSLGAFAGNVNNGSFNTAIGEDALGANLTGIYNTALGEAALSINAGGSYNLAVGKNALAQVVGGTNNLGVGYNAGDNLLSGSDDIYIGNAGNASESGIIRIGTPGTQTQTFIAGVINGDGGGLTNLPPIVVTNNEPLVFLGTLGLSGNLLMSGNLTLPSPARILSAGTPLLSSDSNGNSCFGLAAGGGTGSDNTAIGNDALGLNTSGYFNTAHGSGALYNNTSGFENTADGAAALYSNTNGVGNTACGADALYSITSGSGNIGIGDFGGSNLTTESDNIDIGNPGVPGDSGVIRIGTQGIQTNTYLVGTVSVDGKVGIGTGTPSQALEVNGAIQADGGLTAASITTAGSVQADNATFSSYMFSQGTVTGHTIHSTGFITADTDIFATGSVHATQVYAGLVLLTSDRNAKENFTAINPRDVLAKVVALPVTEWNYKKDDRAEQHLGPMAQDFQAAFGLNGADDKHISVLDEGGVALAAIQGLNQKLNEKDAEIQKLREKADRVDSLEQRLGELEKMFQALSAKK